MIFLMQLAKLVNDNEFKLLESEDYGIIFVDKYGTKFNYYHLVQEIMRSYNLNATELRDKFMEIK